MKKILILYTALGSGHEQIARYIGEHLKEQYQGQVEIKIFDSIEYANKFWFNLHKFAFIYNFNLVSINSRKKIYAQIEEGKSLLTKYDSLLVKMFTNKKIEKFIQDYNPDFIVSTMFGNSQVIGNLKKRGIIDCPLMTVLTDTDAHMWWIRYHEYTDYYIVSNSEMKKNMIGKGVEVDKIKDYGIPISKRFAPNFDLQELKQKYQIKNNNPIFLIFGGGGYGFKTILPYYKKILDLGDSVTSIFIAGKNNQLQQQAEELSKHSKQTSYVYGFTDVIHELMAISDFVITKPGGITVAECITMNKPMVMVNSIGAQEDANLKFVLNNGCGIYCKNVEEFGTALDKMLSDRLFRTKLQENCEKIDQINSIDKVCKILMKSNL